MMTSCGGGESDPMPIIEIVSSTINGSNTSNDNVSIPIDAKVELVFTSALDPAAFSAAFSVVSGNKPVAFSLTYSNASAKVTANLVLEYNTTYTVNTTTAPIGAKGERLSTAKNFTFKTAADDIIKSMPPCTNVGDCLRNIEMTGSQGAGKFEFYSNYPIYEEKAKWEKLTHAVIVVHGASHDPQNYFSYMTNTLQSESTSDRTVLIAPFFRSSATESARDFYWSSTNWRRGSPSTNTNRISSFEAIDVIIDQLSNKDRFPALKKIIITGHSSGAAFTHVFAAANKSELKHPSIDFEYVVANSQFFYYPSGQRVNESNNQLYTPSGCAAYNIWPLGYNATPAYLAGVTSSTFNSQFTSRKVTYLLGNGSQSDPTLNTTDCEHILQGSSRYRRGENMFRFMEFSYQGSHNHKREIVNGIGHDGQGMYQSSEFKTLLTQLLK
jgi:hypothetical protein